MARHPRQPVVKMDRPVLKHGEKKCSVKRDPSFLVIEGLCTPVFVNDVCEHNSTIKSGKCPGTPKNVTPPTLELPYKGFFGEGSYQICENGMASLFRAEGRCPP